MSELLVEHNLDPCLARHGWLLERVDDGVSLATAGPRLVVPGDSRGGRYVTNVVSVRLGPTDDGD